MGVPAKEDPLDLSCAYGDFKLGALVGAELAAPDVDGDGVDEANREKPDATLPRSPAEDFLL